MLDIPPKTSHNSAMKTQPDESKAIIPKGTYVPSNLSDEDRLKQAISNNPNTMGSVEGWCKNLGLGRASRPTSGK